MLVSRFLTDSLNKHGFCVPYKKFFKYERCAALLQGTKMPSFSESSSAEPIFFMYHVADNANHNPRTLDGRNIFSGWILYALLHLLFPHPLLYHF